MPNPRTYGPSLLSGRNGGEQPIPPEFIAAMNRAEEVQAVPNDVAPKSLTDTVISSEVKTDRTGERVRTTISKKAGIVGPLWTIHIDDKGQEVKVLRWLVPTGSASQGTVNAFTTVARQDLGNGWSIDEVAYEGQYTDEGGGAPGVFIPGLFAAPTYSRDNSSVIPEEFRADQDVTTTQVDSAGVAALPGALAAGTYKQTEEQLTQYKKRVETTTQVQPSSGKVLDKGKETNQVQQNVTVVKTLLDDSTLPEVPTATKEVEVEQLGDGHKVQKTKTVPVIFDPAEYVAEVPDNIPRKFAAALPTTTIEHVDAALAIKPTLIAGDLSASQKQLTTFLRRVRTVTRSLLGLPISLVSHETNDKKQDVTVTETYRVAGANQSPSATQDVSVENQGDGNVVETIKAVGSVFPATVSSKQIDDVIPSEFRTDTPNLESETTTAGTVASPALGASELLHTESQIDSYTKKTRSVTRTISLPKILNDSELDGLRVGNMLFSGTVTITRKLSSAGQSISQGFRTIASKVKSLGAGFSLLETGTVDVFPVATDNIVDPVTGGITNRTKTILASGTPHPGTAFTSQEQINLNHLIRIQEVADSTTFLAYIRKFEGFTNVDFPAQLLSVSSPSAFASGGGFGAFNESGFFNLAGQGSGSLSLAGQAQASASLDPDIYPDIRQPWGVNISCTHLLFLVVSGETRANVIARCTTAMGTTVNDWPKFAPKAVNFVCIGQRVSATARATASSTATVRVDYTGNVIGGGSLATSSGGGGSQDITQAVKIVRIPPTIHASLTAANGGFSGTFASLASAAYGATAQITTVGAGTQFSATAQAQGLIWPNGISGSFPNGTITPTSGQSTIPTSGLYLARLTSEPADQGYVKMHAEIIDMGNVL